MKTKTCRSIGIVLFLILCLLLYNRQNFMAIECYLCGNNSESLIGYYRKNSKIGVISLNDWYVLDLTPRQEFSTNIINTGNITYILDSMPGGEKVKIILPQNYSINKSIIQQNLCQECFDKVVNCLGESKIPLCLIDFSTMELYPCVQGDEVIQGHRIDIKQENNEVIIIVGVDDDVRSFLLIKNNIQGKLNNT